MFSNQKIVAAFDLAPAQRGLIVGEMELAHSLLRGEPILAVTGTSGKSSQCYSAKGQSLYVMKPDENSVNQAKELAKKYEITGVPSMVVNGKYRFDLGTAGGPEGVLNVADQLIAKERAAK